jgi:hypothetical protein
MSGLMPARSAIKPASAKGNAIVPEATPIPMLRGEPRARTIFFFGYKVHLIVDATSQLPLEVIVTPGNEPDSPQAIPLLKRAKKKHPDNKMKTSAMDSAYDSHENYRFAIKEAQVAPIIALNPRGGVDALTSNSLQLAKDGSYTCMAGHKVIYWGKEEKRGRLKFRCPAAVGKCDCLFRATWRAAAQFNSSALCRRFQALARSRRRIGSAPASGAITAARMAAA